MRSKYSVSHSERVTNAEKTLEIYGVTLEKNVSQPAAFYHAKLTDEQFAAFWSRVSNEPIPTLGGEVNGFRSVRFTHLAEPYVSLTIPADKALDLIANGSAVEGIALQPAIAG